MGSRDGQFWDNFESTLRQLWDNIETTLSQLWDNFETTLRQLWDMILLLCSTFISKSNALYILLVLSIQPDTYQGLNFGTTLRQLWDNIWGNIETTWRQHWDNFETNLRQHWDNFEATLGQQSRVIKSRATMGLRVVAHVGRLPECLWQPHIISTPLKTTLIIIIITIIIITIIIIITRPRPAYEPARPRMGLWGQDTVRAGTFRVFSTSRFAPPTYSSAWILLHWCGYNFGGYVLGGISLLWKIRFRTHNHNLRSSSHQKITKRWP